MCNILTMHESSFLHCISIIAYLRPFNLGMLPALCTVLTLSFGLAYTVYPGLLFKLYLHLEHLHVDCPVSEDRGMVGTYLGWGYNDFACR